MARPPIWLRCVGGAGMTCGLLLFVACAKPSLNTASGNGTPAASATPSASGTSAGGAATSSQKAQQIMLHVQQANLTNANITWEATLTTPNQGNESATSTGQIQFNPVALHLNATATGTSKLTATQYPSEVILVQGKAYGRSVGQHQWHASSLPMGLSQSLPYVAMQNPMQTQNLVYVGTESVNGVATQHLHGTGHQTTSGQTGTYTEDLWVTTTTYRPARITVQTQSTQGTLTSTATFSNWNGTQAIVAPPATEVAP
jgi:hypothetical protein